MNTFFHGGFHQSPSTSSATTAYPWQMLSTPVAPNAGSSSTADMMPRKRTWSNESTVSSMSGMSEISSVDDISTNTANSSSNKRSRSSNGDICFEQSHHGMTPMQRSVTRKGGESVADCDTGSQVYKCFMHTVG
jgi:hypothetical protein